MLQEFEDLDTRYYAINPAIIHLLGKCLERNESLFIEVAD